MNRDLAKEIRAARSERLETALALQIRAAGLPPPLCQYAFHPERSWRFDFCWPTRHLAVEVMGGMWEAGGGAHQRARRYENDCEKANAAALMGWVLLRFTGAMVESGAALRLLEEALK